MNAPAQTQESDITNQIYATAEVHHRQFGRGGLGILIFALLMTLVWDALLGWWTGKAFGLW